MDYPEPNIPTPNLESKGSGRITAQHPNPEKLKGLIQNKQRINLAQVVTEEFETDPSIQMIYKELKKESDMNHDEIKLDTERNLHSPTSSTGLMTERPLNSPITTPHSREKEDLFKTPKPITTNIYIPRPWSVGPWEPNLCCFCLLVCPWAAGYGVGSMAQSNDDADEDSVWPHPLVGFGTMCLYWLSCTVCLHGLVTSKVRRVAIERLHIQPEDPPPSFLEESFCYCFRVSQLTHEIEFLFNIKDYDDEEYGDQEFV
jgi:hypothetical protein